MFLVKEKKYNDERKEKWETDRKRETVKETDKYMLKNTQKTKQEKVR